MKVREVHIGSCIKKKLKEKNIGVSTLAEQIFLDKTNVYRLFAKKHINTEVLCRISDVLDYNFFQEYLHQSAISENKDRNVFLAIEIDKGNVTDVDIANQNLSLRLEVINLDNQNDARIIPS